METSHPRSCESGMCSQKPDLRLLAALKAQLTQQDDSRFSNTCTNISSGSTTLPQQDISCSRGRNNADQLASRALAALLDEENDSQEGSGGSDGERLGLDQKTQRMTVALDVINLLFRKLKSARRSSENQDSTENITRFSPDVELKISRTIWLHWNHSPGICYKLKATLKTLLENTTAHEKHSSQIPLFQFFLESIRRSVLVEKRSLNILSYILPHLTLDDALQALKVHARDATDFLNTILDAIGDDKLASVSGQLAVQWTSKVEGWPIQPRERAQSKAMCQANWISITLSILFSPEERKRQYLCQYYLVPLFKKRPECFKELSQKVAVAYAPQSSSSAPLVNSFEQLSGIIALARINPRLNNAESQSFYQDKNVQDSLVTEQLLKVCLSHPSISLRSSALSIICQCKATTSALPVQHLDLLYQFFCWNFGEVEAELKQDIFSNLNVLVTRLRDSSCAASKKLSELMAHKSDLVDEAHSSIKESQPALNENKELKMLVEKFGTYIEAVKTFITKILNLCRHNFTISSPYRCQVASLRYLKVFLDSGIDSCYTPIPSEKKLPKPPCFPFAIKIMDINFTRSLVIALTSTYVDIREASFTLLQSCSALESQLEKDVELNRQVVSYAVQCLDSRRESETCTATLLLRLILEKQVVAGSRQVPEILLPRVTDGLRLSNPLALFLYGRLENLEDKIIVAETDLAMASEKHPSQGSIMITSELFKHLSREKLMSLVESNDLLPILEKTIELVKRVWKFSAVVLCHSAPDVNATEPSVDAGTVPDHEEARASEFLAVGEDRNLSDNEEAFEQNEGYVGARHKTILSTCWRSMKEVSGLLTQAILVSITASEQIDPTRPDALLSYQEIMETGQLFQHWLLEIRHRGAFGGIHTAYSTLCVALCSLCRESQLSKLPVTWLGAHIDAITKRELSTTRRSAGLPFCILSTYQSLSLSDPSQLRCSLNTILDLAQSKDISPESQIHILNTLKILLTDAKVSPKVTSLFIERSFDFAITSFVSSDWRVRNGALILFSGLTNRVFGARPLALNRSHTVLCRRETVVDFFQRLPTLHSILLKELQRSVHGGLHTIADVHSQSPMFAVLSLLALLQNPNAASAAEDFLPLAQECLQSRVLKIRSIGADAMTGLIPSDKVPSLICDLMTEAVEQRSYNKVHGLLLLTKRLIEVPSSISNDEKSKIEAKLPAWASVFQRPLQTPLICQSTFLEILESLDSRFDIRLNFAHNPSPKSTLKTMAMQRQSKVPGIDFYETKAAQNLLKECRNPEVIAMLLLEGSSCAKLTALKFIQISENEGLINDLKVGKAILSIARDRLNSIVIRLPALEALSKGTLSFTNSEWPLEEVFAGCTTTPILPIRDILLVIAALNIANTVNLHQPCGALDSWADAFLNRAAGAASEVQSTATRLSAAKALSAFSTVYRFLCSSEAARFLDVAMTLVGDDDDEVRSVLTKGLGSALEILDPMVPVATFERLALHAKRLSAHFPLKRLMKEDAIRADLDQLHNPSQLLFATERFNLYRDDLQEFCFLRRIASEDHVDGDSVKTLEIPSPELASFDRLLSVLSSEKFDNPQNLLDATQHNVVISQRAWHVLASRIASAADILDKQYNYQLIDHQHHAMKRLKQRIDGCSIY